MLLTEAPVLGNISNMNARDAWARRVKRRLERAGFQVSLINPALALQRKKAGRLRDIELLTKGIATPDEIQRKNSIFEGRAKDFQIVDLGGLK